MRPVGILRNYVTETAQAKNKAVDVWLHDISVLACKCILATNVGKFVHSSINSSVVVYKPPDTDKRTDGYIHSGNSNCLTDATVSSAAYLGAAKFLLLELEDGRTIWEHVASDTEFIRREFSDLQVDYNALRKNILQVNHTHKPSNSDEKLRQIYFPLGNEEYHLLSVLPASSLLMEMRRRLSAMSNDDSQARNKKSETYGQNFSRIHELTEIAFGGTKPQNVSLLNNQFGGRAYLLPSFPPTLERRNIALPHRDFFRDTVRPKYFRDMIRRLHDVYCLDRNNLDIRQRARRAEQNIIDRIIDCAYKVREVEVGWSDRCPNLPQAQKIWLDSKYKAERDSAETWREEIAGRFAAWFVGMYERTVGKDALSLGDAEFINLKQEILSAL